MKKKVIIPLINETLSQHFGQSECLKVYTIDSSNIIQEEEFKTQVHGHGSLPQKIKELQADVVLAGGIGEKAIARFKELNIKLICGVTDKTPEIIIEKYLNESLEVGDGVCKDHHH